MTLLSNTTQLHKRPWTPSSKSSRSSLPKQTKLQSTLHWSIRRKASFRLFSNSWCRWNNRFLKTNSLPNPQLRCRCRPWLSTSLLLWNSSTLRWATARLWCNRRWYSRPFTWVPCRCHLLWRSRQCTNHLCLCRQWEVDLATSHHSCNTALRCSHSLHKTPDSVHRPSLSPSKIFRSKRELNKTLKTGN